MSFATFLRSLLRPMIKLLFLLIPYTYTRTKITIIPKESTVMKYCLMTSTGSNGGNGTTREKERPATGRGTSSKPSQHYCGLIIEAVVAEAPFVQV